MSPHHALPDDALPDHVNEQRERAETLRHRLGLSRRHLFAATTGLAAAAAIPLAGPAEAATRRVLVPPGKRGIILYTVRDAITRDPAATTSPSGFRRVLEALSAIGTGRSSSPATGSTRTPRAARTSTASKAPGCCAAGWTPTGCAPRATTGSSPAPGR
ncbi:hypothetical protein GCM10020220_089700 [Nonomuraea rubra]|uniref:hypothetical protein n=1 Tax=Nonomuraea rubra TaxID=46180 RepID=UPI0031EBA42A